MHHDRADPENEADDGRHLRRNWRRPTVLKIPIKQITRGGMMIGSDMMGMMGGMMTS